MDEQNDSDQPRRYKWPWFVLGAVVLGILLAVIWMSVLVHRIREERETNPWQQPNQTIPSQTNPPAVKTNAASLPDQRIAQFSLALRRQ